MGASWINYLFEVAVYLGAAYLFYRFLLRDDVNFLGNRLFLLAMLPASFLLPLAPLQSPFRSLTFDPATLSAAAALPAPAVRPLPWFASVMVVIYWVVAALCLLRILFHLLHLYRLQRRHPNERLRHITLVRVGAPIPPFSFFNRVFLHAAQDADRREIEQIISHESVHIRQFHSFDILVVELAAALQWFNPIIWFYRKALKETHEYLADREVIAQGFNADGYRLLLFEQQFGAKLFEFASHLKQSQIKRRIFMMNRMQGAKTAPYKIILALPLIALLALALAEPRLVIAQATHADEKMQEAHQEAQTVMSEQELKELQLKIELKEKELKKKLAAATDAAEKEKLKQSLDDLYKKRQSLATGHHMVAAGEVHHGTPMDEQQLKEIQVKLAAKEKYLKELYAGADTPEKKEKIKQDLDKLFKKRQELLGKSGVAMTKVEPSREQLEKKLQSVQEHRQKLEQLIAQEKDEEKIKHYRLKLTDMAKFEEELKNKIDAGQAQHH